MSGHSALIEAEDRWVTSMGKSFLGERVVFRGKDLFAELGDIRWMGIHLYGITGRFYSDDQLDLFEAIWRISVSYPDPRIWNNRIAALAGTVRSTCPLAISAASAVTEATVYGHRTNVGAIDFLYRAKKELDSGIDLGDIIRNEMKAQRVIYGYGRPISKVDERIEPLMKVVRKLHVENGMYVQLAFAISAELESGRWRYQLNVGGLVAALAADQGLSVREYEAYTIPGYIGGMTPCYIDALNHTEGTLFPLRCERIEYSGPKNRSWD